MIWRSSRMQRLSLRSEESEAYLLCCISSCLSTGNFIAIDFSVFLVLWSLTWSASQVKHVRTPEPVLVLHG
jgi:hypothetical protein